MVDVEYGSAWVLYGRSVGVCDDAVDLCSDSGVGDGVDLMTGLMSSVAELLRPCGADLRGPSLKWLPSS